MNLEHPDFPAMDIPTLKDAYVKLTDEARDLGLPVKSLPDNVRAAKLVKFCEDLYRLILETKGKKPLQYDDTDVSMLDPEAEQKLAEASTEEGFEGPETIEAPEEKPPTPVKKKKVAKKAAKKVAKKAAKAPTKKTTAKKTTKGKKDQPPISAALGLRSGSKHEQIATFLEAKLGKMVKEKDIIKHVYGDPEVKTNRITDLMKVMNKDIYELRKEVENGVTSYGLYAKKD